MTPDPPAPAPIRLLPWPGHPDAEAARLRLSVHWSAGGCVLSMAGALDRQSACVLHTQFEQLVRGGCDAVVVDVGRLRHIDESGGVALAELWAHLRQVGICCRIHGLHPVFGESPLELLLFIRDSGPTSVSPVATLDAHRDPPSPPGR